MGYIWEARLEAGVDVWRDSEPDAGCVLEGLLVLVGRGDPGTEFRSGAIFGSSGPSDAPVALLDRVTLDAHEGDSLSFRICPTVDKRKYDSNVVFLLMNWGSTAKEANVLLVRKSGMSIAGRCCGRTSKEESASAARTSDRRGAGTFTFRHLFLGRARLERV
jgi:hypothetical protein